MPATLLSAHFTEVELTLRTQARNGARPTLPNPAATARALALAICEVEAGLRSASQLERICHPSLWDAVADRVQRTERPPVSGASVLRVQVQESTPGLVDAVAVVRRGQRITFIALRLEAVAGHWELTELLTDPATAKRRGESGPGLAPPVIHSPPAGPGARRSRRLPSKACHQTLPPTGHRRRPGPAAGRAGYDRRRRGV